MKVFNSLSGQKEEFTPRNNEIKMYVCGVTPYDHAHLGHAMSYIVFDVVRRYLEFRGHKVTYVQNVTDIDDKIINRANKLGISTSELAEKFTKSFLEDMAALNIRPADFQPRATGEIPKILEVIQGLVDKGYAYPAGGSVYFRVRNVPDYGKLSHRTLDSMTAGMRIEPGEEKEHPMDFVLWKAAKPGEPAWPSPWGQGRPGWQIECTAMSLKYLGVTLDIHGGGQDLIFPHHENEIAQSESFTGVKPFVRYWLHNGLLQLGEEKMSKSLGNLVTIKETLAKFSADGVRIFVLSSHYRSPMTYSDEILGAADNGAERLLRVISRDDPIGGRGEGLDAEPYHRRFIEAMDDDFNTPQALGVLFDLARAINQAGDSGLSFVKAKSVLSNLACNVLGLRLETSQLLRMPSEELEPIVNAVIRSRNNLRKAKQWQLADKIRNSLSDLSISLEDGQGRTVSMWKRKGSSETTEADINSMISLLVEAYESLKQTQQRQLADEARTDLDQLNIALEDTPKGTVWKRKR